MLNSIMQDATAVQSGDGLHIHVFVPNNYTSFVVRVIVKYCSCFSTFKEYAYLTKKDLRSAPIMGGMPTVVVAKTIPSVG